MTIMNSNICIANYGELYHQLWIIVIPPIIDNCSKKLDNNNFSANYEQQLLQYQLCYLAGNSIVTPTNIVLVPNYIPIMDSNSCSTNYG